MTRDLDVFIFPFFLNNSRILCGYNENHLPNLPSLMGQLVLQLFPEILVSHPLSRWVLDIRATVFSPSLGWEKNVWESNRLSLYYGYRNGLHSVGQVLFIPNIHVWACRYKGSCHAKEECNIEWITEAERYNDELYWECLVVSRGVSTMKQN